LNPGTTARIPGKRAVVSREQLESRDDGLYPQTTVRRLGTAARIPGRRIVIYRERLESPDDAPPSTDNGLNPEMTA
jgi:hypothetical protein